MMKYCGFILLAGLFLFLSCTKKGQQKEKPLARVHNTFLYHSELKEVVPEGTPAKDSIEMVKNYIQNWVKQQLVAHHAEQNLSQKQKDFSKEIEEYRNSLIVYNYESKLIHQKLDTTVNEKEIEDYYNANLSNFELKDNIVKVLYVKLQLKDPTASKFRNLLKSSNSGDRDKLAQLAAQRAVNSYLDENSWLFFNDLLKEIPIETYNQEEYLQNHRFIEFSDEQYLYMVNILDFKIKEGQSPLSLEKDNIRNIILNKRKILLIKDMEKEVYEQGLKNKDFEIF